MKNTALFCLLFSGILMMAACHNQDKAGTASGVKGQIVYPDELRAMLKLLQEKPDSNGLRFQVATAMDSLGDYTAALAQMDSLLKRDSNNYAFWFTKANIEQEAKDTPKAIAGFERALSIYPSPEALLSLANLYAEKRNPRALAIVKNIQSMGVSQTDNANCEFIAGVYYARTGDTAHALYRFNRCLAVNYTHMPAYIEKGLVYFDHHQYRQALQVFQFASSVNNLYADAYYYMARCYEMMGIKDSAALRFRQSLSLDNTLDESRAGLKRLGAK